MIIVSDTTPLSELAKIGKLDLLQAIFGRVIISQQVYEELTTGNHPAVLAVKLVSWLEVRSINNHELIKKLKSLFFHAEAQRVIFII
ncbi:hypothetical protein [Dolichospermum sp. LEGE 00240]|uniref:hypothetical protein n=1 Tax=Dolichospermum sp. LEGE 00240 TaxID=1828603 RepID=UPI001D15B027|nr:hypothetical protein [Dolichospermum sp. LEGE 00240]